MKLNRQYQRALERLNQGLPPRNHREYQWQCLWLDRHAEQIADIINKRLVAEGRSDLCYWDGDGFVRTDPAEA